jgi:uncharacterized membrane protein
MSSATTVDATPGVGLMMSEASTLTEPLAKKFPWLLVYLLVVIIVHIFALLDGTRMGIVIFWYVAGLPLFIPGIIVGLVYVFVPMRHLKYRLLRLLTGLAAVLLPVWEALVMRQLPTGW